MELSSSKGTISLSVIYKSIHISIHGETSSRPTDALNWNIIPPYWVSMSMHMSGVTVRAVAWEWKKDRESDSREWVLVGEVDKDQATMLFHPSASLLQPSFFTLSITRGDCVVPRRSLQLSLSSTWMSNLLSGYLWLFLRRTQRLNPDRHHKGLVVSLMYGHSGRARPIVYLEGCVLAQKSDHPRQTLYGWPGPSPDILIYYSGTPCDWYREFNSHLNGYYLNGYLCYIVVPLVCTTAKMFTFRLLSVVLQEDVLT